MAISRAQLLKELLPGLNALFGLEYKRYGEEHKEIYEIENSDRSFEEETKLAGFGAAPVKSEGNSISYDNAQEAWTARYTHETIALGFSITEEAVEDNLYDKLSARYTKALARAMAYTKQVKAAAILNNATSASYVYGDGVSLLSTAHPLVNGSTNSNRPTTGVDLNETSLEAAVIAIAAWTDERGLLLAAKPRKLILPPALTFVATRLLETTQRVGTADNDVNAIRVTGSIPGGYTVNHWLTDTNQWFLTTDVPNGLKMFDRAPMTTRRFRFGERSLQGKGQVQLRGQRSVGHLRVAWLDLKSTAPQRWALSGAFSFCFEGVITVQPSTPPACRRTRSTPSRRQAQIEESTCRSPRSPAPYARAPFETAPIPPATPVWSSSVRSPPWLPRWR